MERTPYWDAVNEQEVIEIVVSSAQELEAKCAEYGAENEEKDGVNTSGDPCFICEVETPDATQRLIFIAPTPELARQIWDEDLF